MLSGSLRALDGAVLQHTLGKLNGEEVARECVIHCCWWGGVGRVRLYAPCCMLLLSN
jgi:hypothetical protein